MSDTSVAPIAHTERPDVREGQTNVVFADDERSSTRDESAYRRLYAVGLILVVLLAGIVRAIPLFAAVPYSHYVDEGHVVGASARVISQETYDPGFYDYPSGLIGSSAVVALAKNAVTGDLGAFRAEVDRYDSKEFDDPLPTDLLMSARILVLLSSVGVVLLVAHLGRRLGGRSVGLVAGLIAACLPALVTRSATATVDAPATLFVLASLAAALQIGKSSRATAWAVAAGGLAGLAIGSKYTVGFVFLAVALAIVLDVRSDWFDRVTRVGAAGVAALVAFFVASPAFFLENGVVSQRLSALSAGYSDKTGIGYFDVITTMDEAGWAFLALVGIGLIAAVMNARTRKMAMIVLAFAVPFAFYLSRFSFQPFRNYYPLLALGCVAAAITVVVGGRTIAEVGRIHRPWSFAVPAVLAGCIAWMFLPIAVDQVHAAAQVTDSRSQVRAWFADLEDCGRVLIPSELGFHPSEFDDFDCDEVVVEPAVATESGGGDTAVDLADFDYLVTASMPREVAEWAEVRWIGLAASFGSAPIIEENWENWRSSYELLRVYDLSSVLSG